MTQGLLVSAQFSYSLTRNQKDKNILIKLTHTFFRNVGDTTKS